MKRRVEENEIIVVKTAMKAEVIPRVQRRLVALYMFLSGLTCKEVAHALGITPSTVSNINRKYKKWGVKGLYDKVKFGRPSRLSLAQQYELKLIVLNKHPSELGLSAKMEWSASIIAKYISQYYKYDYSIRGITQILRRLGFRYVKKKYVCIEK